MATECPACGAQHDRVSGYNVKDPPRTGDISVCFKCGAINEFDRDLALVLVPAKECRKPDMVDAREAQAKVCKMRGYKP